MLLPLLQHKIKKLALIKKHGKPNAMAQNNLLINSILKDSTKMIFTPNVKLAYSNTVQRLTAGLISAFLLCEHSKGSTWGPPMLTNKAGKDHNKTDPWPNTT